MKKHVLAIISFVVIFSVVFCNVFVTQASTPVGDVNGDGKVNSSDALAVLRYSVGLSTGIKDMKPGDIDHNGKINSNDALIILRISVGLANPKDYTTTTKPTTTTTKPIQFTPAAVKEVSPSSVTKYAGTIQRAWKISSKTTSVEIHKVAYGSKITQNFVKKQDSAIDYQKSVTYQPICNIAIVTCAPTTLKYAVTSQVLGTTKGKQEDISKKVGALMAVNGESTSAARAMPSPMCWTMRAPATACMTCWAASTRTP